MDERDEKSLDNMVQSLMGQIDANSALIQAIRASQGDAKAWEPVLFTMAHIIQELDRQVGYLDARITAFENQNG